ncbi:MAG: bile acid:sodium symporter family protein [Candidatus Ornithospirochaeta sp.]|nr:bile acid:sodium symporter family protein [Candidatus Ornithospirochaeta sp.]
MIQDTFRSFDRTMKKIMPFITPLGVIAGLLLAKYIKSYKFIVTPLFAFITFVGAIGMNFSDFSHVLRKPRNIFISLVLSHVLVPVTVFLLGSLLFRNNPDIVTGFILLYSIPTAVVSYIWSQIFSGNGPLSLTLILIDTVLAPILTPLTVRILARSTVTIDTSGMIISLLWMVVLPVIIGVIVNTLSKGYVAKNVKLFLDPFTKIALFFVVSVNVAQIADKVVINQTTLYVILVNILFCAGGFFFTSAIIRLIHIEGPDRVTLTFSSSLRNISAALVLAISFFPPESAIPVVIGILMQQITASLCGTALFGQKKM